MNHPKIKICGLTCVEDAGYLNENKVDFAGIVLFFPKSKRNMELSDAEKIIKALNSSIKKVAVTVSPALEQIRQIEKAGFDYIQIHGDIPDELLKQINIPIFRAFNINPNSNFEAYGNDKKIVGYVVDGKIPGGGNVFDWSLVKDLNWEDKLLMLAGGLNPENVLEGIDLLKPDIVDVSTGVENDTGTGKDPDKIKRFVNTVRKSKESI